MTPDILNLIWQIDDTVFFRSVDLFSHFSELYTCDAVLFYQSITFPYYQTDYLSAVSLNIWFMIIL